jgi:PIN domain nuclease of toxin-antitoxin system
VSDFLLDTQALLWWLADDPRLPTTARELIADPGNLPVFSAASAWEISIKAALRKLEVADDWPEAARADGFGELSIHVEHARLAGHLEWDHRDPFDRMLVAQALIEGVTLITGDARIRAFSVSSAW